MRCCFDGTDVGVDGCPVMDVSVIICTYNCCESLRRTLDTCCDLVIPKGLTWELLIVDNNSTDDTKQVCAGYTSRLPLFYLFEGRQGKSCALNCALHRAQGDLLLFSDADVDVDQHWLTAMTEAAHQHVEASVFGGKVMPRWEDPPPRWISEKSHPVLDYIFPHYDLGSAARLLRNAEEPFFGANLAIRGDVVRSGRRFNELLGPQGKDQVHGEESEFQRMLFKEGHRGMFIPQAVVYHRNYRDRMTERYLRRYCKGIGLREIRLAPYQERRRLWCGAPPGYWRTLIRQALRYLTTRPTCRAGIWVEAEMQMSMTWGRICEIRRQIRRRAIARP